MLRRRPPAARRAIVLLACVVLGLWTAWYAGSRFDPPARSPAAGTVALGPGPGEAVRDYLDGLPAELPVPGVEVLALVQLAGELPADQVAELLAAVGADAPARSAGPGSRTGPPSAISAVFHVPLPRVQTALRFAMLDPDRPLPTALSAARAQARFAADADAGRRTGRAAAVAAAEAAALAEPGCRCLLALVVRADRPALEALASRPAVRAVHAAPAGVVPVELAVSPLLPGNIERADPLPDDGFVPPA